MSLTEFKLVNPSASDQVKFGKILNQVLKGLSTVEDIEELKLDDECFDHYCGLLSRLFTEQLLLSEDY